MALILIDITVVVAVVIAIVVVMMVNFAGDCGCARCLRLILGASITILLYFAIAAYSVQWD